jgi:hypothetical protein
MLPECIKPSLLRANVVLDKMTGPEPRRLLSSLIDERHQLERMAMQGPWGPEKLPAVDA